ncbi:TetR/AcrR family transcriptional regulator [Streptomyces sp. PSKA01]|uniref:TetR/AcrR family transcriptional regulator n=1 Tax=Streptomyces cupreus TaxID=2759956 RepID=A0A7X1J4D4_9ACTN|nr:TetR/AcrR family transcriptional regulator [Streptomyces cupreus]
MSRALQAGDPATGWATGQVIWARPERTGRGPRPAYSRADIAAAAVRIADAEGLDSVSMRRVAAEVGCGTMSLYNYVPRKADLYELMVDEVSAEYELPDDPGLAERVRSVAWSAERELSVRGAYMMSRVMTGEYPRLAAEAQTITNWPSGPSS